MKKFAVVLCGCGPMDGSEIHESVMTLLAIDRNECQYTIFAPDADQFHVVNHYTKEVMNEKRNMLVEEFLRCGRRLDFRDRRLIDVQNIFHKMEPRNLVAAYKLYCGKNLDDAHQAEADTRATYEVLKAQLDKYQNQEYEDRRTGVKSVPIQNDVKALSSFSSETRMVDFAGHIVFNERDEEVFNFGKHKGETVENVFRKEPSYYAWMMNADFPLYTKEIITKIKERMF